MGNSFLTTEEHRALNPRNRESTRNCLQQWLSRRNGRLCSILVMVPPQNSPLQFTERDWTKLRLSTRILMEDSRAGVPSPRKRAWEPLVLWWLRLILMLGSHLMAMQTECTSLTKRESARCKIEYSHPTSPFLRKGPRVLSWFHSTPRRVDPRKDPWTLSQ